MKKQIIFLLTVFIFLPMISLAQIEEHPINETAKKIAENEMFGLRFLRNFLFIKNNIFKQKAIKDMDLTMAKFDDNLTKLTLVLPKDKKIEENYLELQNFWNAYRLKIMDYESEHIESIVEKSIRFKKLLNEFNSNLIKKIHGYDDFKKQWKQIQNLLENEEEIEKTAIVYVLKRGMKQEKIANDYFNLDINSVRSNLRKILRNKKLPQQQKEIYMDLNETTNNIAVLLGRSSYQPKLMYSYLQNFSNKTYKLLDYLTKNQNK